MINKVILVGRLGKDPETKHLENESQVSRFSVATDDGYFDKAKREKVEQTEWHNVICWNGLSKVVEQYLKKGSSVYVEGNLKTRKWEDSNGVARYSTEVVCRTLKMLSKKESGGYQMPTAEDAPQASNTKKEMDKITEENEPPKEVGDDLPF